MFGLVLALLTAFAPHSPAPSRFVVHEWGTFTNLQGSDGVALEGLDHEEEALPGFVHDLLDPAEVRHERVGKGGVDAVRVFQKMETPVVYFYTDEPRRVTLDVGFNRGIVSQWFPQAVAHRVSMMMGAEPPASGPIPMDQVQSSSVRWSLDLVPFGAELPSEIPAVADDDPWAFAREVPAASVRTHGLKGAQEAERYVFYRGLGAMRPQIHVVSNRRGSVLNNRTGLEIPWAAALEVTPEGARFTDLGAVAATPEGRRISHAGALRPLDEVVAALEKRVSEALVAEGLYAPEARAMVRTWSRSWFRSEGTRVVYILPRDLTQRMLTLSVQPTPDAVVRVLVGRVDYLTAETEAQVERALRDYRHRDPQRRAQARERLDRLGRFLEPHLRRIVAKTSDRRVRRVAHALIEEARQTGVASSAEAVR